MNSFKKSKTLQFLLACAVVGPLLMVCAAVPYFSGEAKKKEAWLSTGMPALGRTVRADRDIIEGTIIKANDVVERPERPENVPPDALMCSELVIGHQAHFSIAAGIVITAVDLVDGEAQRAEQVRRFNHGGKKPSAICAHTTGTPQDSEGKTNNASDDVVGPDR